MVADGLATQGGEWLVLWTIPVSAPERQMIIFFPVLMCAISLKMIFLNLSLLFPVSVMQESMKELCYVFVSANQRNQVCLSILQGVSLTNHE